MLYSRDKTAMLTTKKEYETGMYNYTHEHCFKPSSEASRRGSKFKILY